MVRTRLQTNSDGWRLITALQREAWASLGAEMVRNDTLGQTVDLTGFQAYMSVNNNNLAAGNAVVSDPPLFQIPSAIVTVTPTATVSTLSIAFTPTPLSSGERIFVSCSPPRSAGRTYEGDYRLIQVSSAAGTSPLSVFTAYSARFGAPVVGQRIFVSVQRYLLGFLSTPLNSSCVVA